MKYRKKPLVIEAIKYLGPFSLDEMVETWGSDFRDKCKFLGDPGTLLIHTLEGYMYPAIGDYVIRGIKEEFYSCKPDIFEASYDKVEE